MPFRTGRRKSRNIYWQPGPEPTDADPAVGFMDTDELGKIVVESLNEVYGFLPHCAFCQRPVIAHQGQLCSPPTEADDA